jgi:hypothetical protein
VSEERCCPVVAVGGLGRPLSLSFGYWDIRRGVRRTNERVGGWVLCPRHAGWLWGHGGIVLAGGAWYTRVWVVAGQLGLFPALPTRKEIEMTKTTNPTPFNVEDRVAVATAATGGEEMTGTISAISKGWFLITLDEEIENAKGEATTTVSARVSSIRLLTVGEDPEQDGTEEGDDEAAGDEQDDVEAALDEAEEHASKMAQALAKARQHYVKDRRPNGAATAHNGDAIARELRDLEPLEVANLADRCLKLEKGFHANRYCGIGFNPADSAGWNLNPGQVRMNSGNKIRGAWNKAEKDGDEETLAHLRRVLGWDEVE